MYRRRLFRENVAEDRDDLIELLLSGDQRRRDLNDRIAPVVGAADQPPFEQGRREKAAKQGLALLVVEGLACLLVFHELDGVEEACSTNVADDREVEKLLERLAERVLRLCNVLDDAVTPHDTHGLPCNPSPHR